MYVWNLKKWYKQSYFQNRNRVIDVENQLRVTRGKGVRGGTNWEIGIDRHTNVYKIENQ